MGQMGDHEDGMKQNKEAHANGSTLEVHILDSGKILVRGAKVTSVSGSTVNAATTWGSVSLAWAVNTDTSTEWVRRFGGSSSVSEISVGDFISFHGDLVTTTASPVTVNADVVKDWSIQKRHATFNGTVKSVDAANMKFVISSEDRGDVNVSVSSSTKIMKGDSVAAFADIAVGARVMAGGLYDSVSKVLSADMVKIYMPEAVRTTLEGTIKAVNASSLVITTEDKDYTVNIGADTSVLNSIWLKTILGNFKVGDNIRVYGTVNANLTVDATVVRDTSLHL